VHILVILGEHFTEVCGLCASAPGFPIHSAELNNRLAIARSAETGRPWLERLADLQAFWVVASNTDKPLNPYWARWAYWVDGLLILRQCRQTKAGLFLWEPAGSDCHFPCPGEAARVKGWGELDEDMCVLRGNGEGFS